MKIELEWEQVEHVVQEELKDFLKRGVHYGMVSEEDEAAIKHVLKLYGVEE